MLITWLLYMTGILESDDVYERPSDIRKANCNSQVILWSR